MLTITDEQADRLAEAVAEELADEPDESKASDVNLSPSPASVAALIYLTSTIDRPENHYC